MRMILAAAAMAALVGAASAASATTFTGSFTVTAYTGNTNNGLQIDIDPLAGGYNFNRTGLDFGESQTFNLFEINAAEDIDPSGNDGAPGEPIHVDFTFSSPSLPGGGPDGVVNGLTVGIDGNRSPDYGQVSWSAPVVVNFGSAGLLTITLLPTTFGEGDNHSGTVQAKFALAAPAIAGVGAVPEPATWGMMIMGFGLTGATMRRRRTAVAAA